MQPCNTNLVGTLTYVFSFLLLLGAFLHISGYDNYNFFSSPHAPVVEEEPEWRLDPGEYVLSSREWDVRTEKTIREYNWTVSEIEASPDGVLRPMVVVNGHFPGPLLRANVGDTLLVHVHNSGTNSTSIHFHGQSQHGTNTMDGAAGITSCAIAPGASFTYNFTASPSGTFWWHAHVGTQRIDGVFGPMIVHAEDEEDVEEGGSDQIVLVHDHYHDLSTALIRGYLSPGRENAEPVPNAALINGRNLTPCPPNRECALSGAPLTGFNLESGKTHRLRFINAGAFAAFDVSVDGHEMTLVEVDATRVENHSFHRLRINVAQRYSVLVTSRDDKPFYMRAIMRPDCFADVPEELQLEVKAIVNPSSPSSGAIVQEKPWGGISEQECQDLNLTFVRMLPPARAPAATHHLSLRSGFKIGAYQLSRGFFNDSSWRMLSPNTSVLQEFISHYPHPPAPPPEILALPAHLRPPLPKTNTIAEKGGVLRSDMGFNSIRNLIYALPSGRQVVELTIENFDDGEHPIHLHGHAMWLVASGDGYPADWEQRVGADGIRTAEETSILRDVVTVPAFGWTKVRVQMDAGVWALHCHLAWHVAAGMMGVVIAEPGIVAGWGAQVEKDVDALCRDEQTIGGMVDDSEFEW